MSGTSWAVLWEIFEIVATHKRIVTQTSTQPQILCGLCVDIIGKTRRRGLFLFSHDMCHAQGTKNSDCVLVRMPALLSWQSEQRSEGLLTSLHSESEGALTCRGPGTWRSSALASSETPGP